MLKARAVRSGDLVEDEGRGGGESSGMIVLLPRQTHLQNEVGVSEKLYQNTGHGPRVDRTGYSLLAARMDEHSRAKMESRRIRFMIDWVAGQSGGVHLRF